MTLIHSDLINQVTLIHSDLINQVTLIHSDLINQVTLIHSDLINQVTLIHSDLINQVTLIHINFTGSKCTMRNRIVLYGLPWNGRMGTVCCRLGVLRHRITGNSRDCCCDAMDVLRSTA